ncbi:hypothetical protein E1B28_001508 [Marasmius oreades]|nr:uncharacterized protein E1B28_001508 [Marasmius oreades]KAG7099686.1 hypothetical protein E1B28_001508 [Marasmius oreades]
MEPHPPYVCPSALEARHWGATYALYRFCNGIQLSRVLPRGPADYWNLLATEHKNAPEHQKWMYNTDPFAAKKEVEERQTCAAEKRANVSSTAGNTSPDSSSTLSEFSQAPEVRMATGLREFVEDAIKKGMSMYPETVDQAALILPEDSCRQVEQGLLRLGFTAAQARNAVKFLSSPSSIAATLLESLSPLEASIEYLVLHVPECDLPKRFLPSSNSSNPFITSAHSGTEDLKKRWAEDKAVKVAGWPPHLVKELTSDPRLVEDWSLLISALGKRLVGEDIVNPPSTMGMPYVIDAEEASSLGVEYEDPNHLVMPLFSAPASLHVLVSPDGSYPRVGNTPVYLTSSSIPSYVRLHLLSQLLQALKDPEFMSDGEGFCMAAMRHLEDAWASVEAEGPPDVSEVLKHILPTRKISTVEPLDMDDDKNDYSPTKKQKSGTRRFDPRTDGEVREQFESICRNPKYVELLVNRKDLPSFSTKQQFLDLLEMNRVVVVVGETGCGKTTQLPQFILDSLILSNQGARASVLIAQPRRLSAIGVAARVSAERLDDGSVGYAIRGESKQNVKTKLLFCTTGVVLRRLSMKDNLEDVTHVVVDEVHERSLDGDFLMLELRNLLKRNAKIKVVLMSATINHEMFMRYFNGAPLLNIPGSVHPVTDKYLEDVIPAIRYDPSGASNKQGKGDAEKVEMLISQGVDERSASAIIRISRSERIDYQLIAVLVRHIMDCEQEKGGVLIFLPGVQEIRQCIDALKSVTSSAEADILPLHASLSNQEQMRVFAKTKRWKLIASTNVAETSITIDDVIYVLDSGKVKETQYDHEMNLSKLVETWVTQAAARQRRGRAGRTRPGICYKLYTRAQEEKMSRFPVPEILRVPLENISLSVKAMRENEDVKLYLGRAIDPPPLKAMEMAWSTLEELGAINDDGKITALGRHMSLLPIDLRLAKMLVLGTVFRCLEPMLKSRTRLVENRSL